jgi:hypothetical protein
MTLVDDQGRLFGRWNVVDALVGIVLLGLIPLLYGGYALFRPQSASLVSIEPARIQSPGDVDVTIHGNNLRPYMRVSFDGVQGRSYLFGDTTKAVVRAAELPPGVYDVILYDNAQERARLPKAFEVMAAPAARTQLDVIGSFTAISEALASQLKPDLEIAGFGRIISIGKRRPSTTHTTVAAGETLSVPSASAVNVPALIRATCTLVQRGGSAVCMALENSLMRGIVLTVPLAGANAMFQIDQVRDAAAPASVEVRARLAGERAVVERVQRGDRDIQQDNEFATGGEIISASAVARAASSIIVSAQTFPGATPSITVGDLATVEVILRLPAQQTVEGWSYRGQTLTAGRSFVFRGPSYEVSGTVLSVGAK